MTHDEAALTAARATIRRIRDIVRPGRDQTLAEAIVRMKWQRAELLAAAKSVCNEMDGIVEWDEGEGFQALRTAVERARNGRAGDEDVT